MNTQSDTEQKRHYRGEMDGTKPITNRKSKMVMLRGERGDQIKISEVVSLFNQEKSAPETLRILQRTNTYYGPEMLLEATVENHVEQFLLTAPGPDTFLYLWSAQTDSDGFRTGWSAIAEVKAAFEDSLPQYPICDKCGEPIKSLEHERLSIIDACSG